MAAAHCPAVRGSQTVGADSRAMKTAHFSFDANLAALLPRARRSAQLDHHFAGPQSVKHLIESLGIPHTEVGSIFSSAQLVTLNYQVRDGDRIEVRCSTAEAHTGEEPRFVLDGHLGRLNSGLRMLGMDCLYGTDYQDDDLALFSVSERRILLTRDRRLLMRKLIAQGYLVRSLEPRQQLAELMRRFHLEDWFRPFSRCIRCNGLLQPVDKQAVVHKLQPLTRLYFEDFRICPSCRQIYWRGSHVQKMMKVIADLRQDGPVRIGL